jgi:alpha-L-fucosidase 2
MNTSRINLAIDWESFMSRHDLIWDRLPCTWDEGPFLGNGNMGTMIYRQPGTNGLRFEVCRADVQDHRDLAAGGVAYSRPRLPIGYFLLEPVGTIVGGTMRLDLWNAETVGRIETDRGSIEFSTIVHSDEMAIIVELKPDAGEQGCRWRWNPIKADSPRQVYGLEHNDRSRIREDYRSNPDPVMKKVGPVDVCVQPLLAGGQTATAWQESEGGMGRTLVVSVAHSWPEETALGEAVGTVSRIIGRDRSDLVESHRSWWHSYYPLSFVSIPDPRIESFYWIQMYKLGAATRADRPLIDNHGPWLEKTPWPYATWNLNVQLTYWPVCASNRLSLGESLWRTIGRHQDDLINNVPEEYRHDSASIGTAATLDLWSPVGSEKGNFIWALHNCWLCYRYSMDEDILRDVLYPLLRRAVNYYRHLLYEGEDGRLHLPETSSPEYGRASDCNYDLALLRWGCTTLLSVCQRLGIDDELIPEWMAILSRLVDFQVDDTGLMIGRGVPYAMSHRHYSHMLMVYPLYLLNIEQPSSRELIVKSLEHWHSMPERLQGYSFTGAASIAAALGDGDSALRYLRGLWKFLRPNTMYKEAGPVIETPLSGAQSIHDMLLQSWGDKIRVFPAVPAEWEDIVIHDMRAEGAFLVSAVRRNGQTEFVRIKSLAGEPCRVKTDLKEPVRVVGDPRIELRDVGDGVFEIGLAKGEEVVLSSVGVDPDLTIAPLSVENSERNYYGLRANPTQPASNA